MDKLLWGAVIVLVGVVYYNFTMSDEVAVEALTKQGFADITITRRWPLIATQIAGCGEGDIAAFNADATNVRGEKVSDIIVCTGLFKGTTIRF